MGNQKQKWKSDEEEALQAGVAKHGPGKWKNILKDPEFAPFLTTRSNIDLKDKWRNLSVSNSAQGSKERSRNPKPKTAQSSPVSNVQNPAPALIHSPAPAPALHQTVVSAVITNDPSNKTEGKDPPGSYAIFDALSTIKDSNGSDVNSIYKFIEQKYDVSHNFRKQLGTKLRRLVAAGKLEKVQNNYKLKNETTLATNSPTPKPKDVRPRQIHMAATMTSTETVKDASDVASRLVAKAEQKSTASALAVHTYETLSKLAEETDSVLQLVKDIHEQCSIAKWLHQLKCSVSDETSYEMSKEDDTAEVVVEQDASVGVDAAMGVDVEEGEISDSDSVEEITQEDFHKQQQQEEEKERKSMSTESIGKDDPRVWAQVCDLYTKYPTISRGYAPGLYHLAWAQAVQNKPLNEIFIMGGDPKTNETAANSSSTSTSFSSTSNRSPASVNEVNLDLNGKDNNFGFPSFGNGDDNLVQKQQNHPKKAVDQVLVDDSDDEKKLEPKAVYPEVLGIDNDKEEGELEEGEIDLEIHIKANDASPSQQGERVEMRQPDEQQDLPMKQEEHELEEQEQRKERGLSPHTSHVEADALDDSDPYSKEKDLEHYLNSIQEALDCVTMVNAEKSFGEACSQMQAAFSSLLQELPKCSLSTKEYLIPISFNTLEVVNSEFQSLNDYQKEEARDGFSRFLCLVKDRGTPIFSPEHMKEIQYMMDSLGSLDTLAILTTAKDQMEGRSLESHISVNQQIASLSNLSVPLSSGECKSTAPPVVSTARGRGGLLPLLDLHKDHDADSLPSPTREVQSSASLSKVFSHGDGSAKHVSVKPKLDQCREDPRIRFYGTEAIKAVSTYQQRFGRNSILSGEKFPSPTPSDNCDDGETDTSEEVSSIPSVGLSKFMRPPAIAQAATSSTTTVDTFCEYGLSTSTNTAPLSAYNSLKISSKNRDPRLRFVNSASNSLDLNHCLFPAPQNIPQKGNTEIMSSRKQKSGDELSSRGPVFKKQKNELECFVHIQDVKTSGWLENTNVTGLSLSDRSQILQAAEANSVKVTGPLAGTRGVLNNLNSASIGIEQESVTSSNATPSLPALFKGVAVNPFMLANLLKMGQQMPVGESLHRSIDSAGSKTEPSASNPTLGAATVVTAAPLMTVDLQKSVGVLPFSSQATSGCVSDESTKIRMKPRDPRRILHGGTLQRSGSFGIEQFKSILPHSSCSQVGGDNINGKKTEFQAETIPMLSQAVVAPDVGRQFTKNLKSLADVVSVSQVAANLAMSAQNLSSVARPIQSDLDFRSSSRSEDQHTGMITLPESGAAGTPQSQCTWGDFEHLFVGYNEKQKASIQRERARRIEEQRKMFAARKLCLVLDLDHTLLNSAKFGEVDPVHEDILRKKEEQDREKPMRHLFCFPRMGMWTKLRPGIWNFLEKASKLYELHLYTMGNKVYATEMAKVLDPKGVLFAGRVISKGDDGDPFDGDERVPKSKDLEGVLGMESAVVIIDDSVRVWPHNKLNLIVVERYTYFPCSRREFGLHGPSLLEIDHDERPEDGTLASSLGVIERIHQNFFTHKTLEEADARNILATEQRKILAGCRVVFSRVFPVGDAKPHLHPLWQTAEQFGAVCTNQIDEQVTHVVANSLGTDKVNWALSTGRYVVHPGWVEASALLYRRANELDFAIKP